MIRILEGQKDHRCPACKRKVTAGRKHKARLGGDAWCDGVVNVQRELAMKLLVGPGGVYGLYSQGFDLMWNQEDLGPCIAFCRKVLVATRQAGIKPYVER